MAQNAHVARLITIWLADDPFPRLVPRVRRRSNRPRRLRFVKSSTKKNADSAKHASENKSVGYVRQFVDFIVKGIRQGVDIGYQGP